ncbi:Gfo/Idh/MocA family oxidoreductase [Maribellus sp. CM-23]|uniref:Gfo/Idh/MocA family protein n=1 Tax=Maribellus sp. CM-23 TaxID=2781026 RepID=UPI001F279C77|nr:Gfo/Idh/MocA family oxidoreductase [Maribellus sp. CM-23]MCE4565029.1 Gfo/Idh/MocA family oxidoreductase [Maribellus sp. CM-23]
MTNRRNFIINSAIAGAGVAFAPAALAKPYFAGELSGKKVGIIGLDTSHSIAFTKAMNTAENSNDFLGYKVVAAYPQGSLDIKSSVDTIEGYTKQMREMGITITRSIDELLNLVDVVLLETNDGRRHLEQAIPVLKLGKRMFIDKPMTASLADAITIFDAANHYGVPVFSSSSLRYIQGMDEVLNGAVGKVLGAETYSPAPMEKTHPDLFWYGIHGVEPLFTAMGTGCKTVTRAYTPGADVVTGIWQDGRIGTFRGIRKGESGYGGRIFGEKAIKTLGSYNGYNPLLKEIVKYFDTGKVPVQPVETLEILAFMEAADVSVKNGGKPVSVDLIMEKARKQNKKYKYQT